MAVRGWGAEDFARATPEFLAACRWLVMAERMVPELADMDATAASHPDRTDKDFALHMRAKVDAVTAAKEFRAWLFPPDEV